MKVNCFRLVSLVAMAVCGAILVDYVLPQPAFCGFRSGCDAVIFSEYGRVLGVPLPVLGLVAFGGFFGLTLFPGSKVGRLLGPLALVAGACGLGLIALQMFVLKQVCPLCLIVDASAVGLAAVELAFDRKPLSAAYQPRKVLWSTFAVIVIVSPLLWAIAKPMPPVPEAVKEYWMAGKVTVVEITDFECPYCRQTHSAMNEFLAEQGERVRFVRLVLPLPHHKHARQAARAYSCAVDQNKGEAMADVLFAAEDLSQVVLDELATSLGLDMQKYQACVAADTTDEAIDQQTAWMDRDNLPGLPLIYIQDQTLLGMQTVDSLRAALRRVERRGD